MTLKEASGRFCISMEKLAWYEENRLILYETLVDGVPDYTEEELHKVSIIHDLLEAGMGVEVLQEYLQLLRKKNNKQGRTDQDHQKAAVQTDGRDTPKAAVSGQTGLHG